MLIGVNITELYYQPVLRKPANDIGFRYGPRNYLNPLLKIHGDLTEDFLYVTVKTSDGKIASEYQGGVVPKDDVVMQPRKPGGLPVNVMIVGFDTLSYTNFQVLQEPAYVFSRISGRVLQRLSTAISTVSLVPQPTPQTIQSQALIKLLTV